MEDGSKDEERADAGDVSLFDYSLDTFFSHMDAVSSLSAPPLTSPHLQSAADLDRLSSTITFLKEWKDFCYEPKSVSFVYETGTGQSEDKSVQITLPQFSSASVPQVELSGDEAQSHSSDFVLCAGGNVWALDWCPLIHNPASPVVCEYLAVASHQPGSTYHKMGAPLTGRGAVQIWSVVTLTETVDFYTEVSAGKRRPRKTLVNPSNPKVKESKSLDSTVEKRKRGRPRKHPNDDEPSLKRPRGRPRKDGNLPLSRLISSPYLGFDLGQTALALPPKSSSSGGRGKKGKPQSKSATEMTVCTDLICVETGERKRRGRPRKNPLPCANGRKDDSTPPSALDSLDNDLPLSVLWGKKASKGKKMISSTVVSCLPEVEAPTVNLASLEQCIDSSFDTRKDESTLSSSIDSLDTTMPLCLSSDRKVSPNSCLTIEESQIDQSDKGISAVESGSFDGNSESQKKPVSSSSSTTIPKKLEMPRLVLCLGHNGKVAWDVKWRPAAVSNSVNSNSIMGYLAVLLGNGSLEVWEVPLPSTVRRIYSCSKGNGGKSMRDGTITTDPRFLKLQPVFRCSKLNCGDRLSIPLTVEWSPSPPNDMILAGCHDGTVALWKFSIQNSCQDTKPLVIFNADSLPIRALSWAPFDCSSDEEISNLFVTAGSEGLKFWDLRDPYRPLWELNPAQRAVLSIDWLNNPRCIIMSFEDGSMRFMSLTKAVSDVAVTGQPFVRDKNRRALFNYNLSHFAIWSVHVSRTTGLVAYCGADGSAVLFQLTARFLEREPGRNRTPHFLCGSLKVNTQSTKSSLKVNTRSTNFPLSNVPLPHKKCPAPSTGDEKAIVLVEGNGPGSMSGEDEEENVNINENAYMKRGYNENRNWNWNGNREEEEVLLFPAKEVAMHRVRWNMNRGSERWLCFGGAAGIVRCQKIPLH